MCTELIPVKAKWESTWTALGLPAEERHATRVENNNDCDKCLMATIEIWLKQNYDTERHGKPSWKMLVQAVCDPGGGNNRELAERIAKKYEGSYTINV